MTGFPHILKAAGIPIETCGKISPIKIGRRPLRDGEWNEAWRWSPYYTEDLFAVPLWANQKSERRTLKATWQRLRFVSNLTFLERTMQCVRYALRSTSPLMNRQNRELLPVAFDNSSTFQLDGIDRLVFYVNFLSARLFFTLSFFASTSSSIVFNMKRHHRDGT